MDETPHLDASGTAFFNGSSWAHVTRHHVSDSIPAWAYDLIFVFVVLGAIVGLTVAIAGA
jgi:hypothetical protein